MSAALLVAACTSGEPLPPVHPPAPVAPPAPALPTGTYVVSVPLPATHRVRVELATRCRGDGLELWMPVWTPGSYLVREFARNVEEVAATDASGALAVRKVAKNRWRVACSGDGPVEVTWSVYARALSVREDYVDDRLGVLNGAATFLFPDDDPGPFEVRLELPEGFTGAASPLASREGSGSGPVFTGDVDQLIDGPIVLGQPQVRSFEVGGIGHRLVTVGEPGPWDADRAAEDVARVASEVAAFWGTVPYPAYTFLVVLAEERGGGLEHLDGTLLVVSRWSQARQDDRLSWLSLVAHEHFHAWNVKRMRPVGLGPFDYERETYTPSLWVAEGLTSYYDDLLLARAGLADEGAFLGRLSKSIQAVQETPGRRFEPLSEASFDTWIEHYRPDEDSPNRTIDYYAKGAVVGFLLDARIRRATDDRRSLDDVLRTLYARTLEQGYTPEDVRAVASEVAGTDLATFFDRHVDGTAELDYGPALDWWGLAWKAPDPPPKGSPVPGWLGAKAEDRGGRLVLAQVRRDTPAWDAGLSAEDELLAIDGFRVGSAGDLDTRLAQLGADRTIELLVARRGVVRTVPVELGGKPPPTWTLEAAPGASPIAVRRRARWLGGDD